MAMEDLFVPENERFFGKNELMQESLFMNTGGLICSRLRVGQTATISKHRDTKEMSMTSTES